MNYKKLVKGTKLYEYSDLSNEAKTLARQEILNSDVTYLSKDKAKYKASIIENVHFLVNNSNIRKVRFNYFSRRKNHIEKTKIDLKYCESYIKENLCNFLKNGIYVTYSF